MEVRLDTGSLHDEVLSGPRHVLVVENAHQLLRFGVHVGDGEVVEDEEDLVLHAFRWNEKLFLAGDQRVDIGGVRNGRLQ